MNMSFEIVSVINLSSKELKSPKNRHY